jgi:long-chain acyl-CoA synthetase
VLRPGTTADAAAVIEWCREQMANYKVPRAVDFVDALPLNATGKVQKDVLRERAAGLGATAGLLHAGLERAADRFGERDALLAGEERWTFRDLDGASNSFARYLTEQGVGAGDRVAVMTTNRPEFVVAVYGISKVGASVVLLSPAWKALEVEHALALTAPAHAVADGAGASLLGTYLGADRTTDLDEASTVEAALAHNRARRARGVGDEGDDVVLVFSSGTTGLPKAVRHTHRSIRSATSDWCTALGLGPDDRFQVATPPSHILGLLNLLAAVSAGATVRLHPRFDLDEVLQRIESERMTLEMAVAPIALAMANHPRLEDYDLSSLRFIMWGATPVTASVADAVTERTGVRWLAAYGASELPVIAANPVDRPDRWRLDSAGLPPDGVELRVVDLEGGEVVHAGGTGEIQARSASLMAGYLPDEANADAFDDGWYRTGDVGWLEPDGWVHLTDRSKEMMKVNGFQVAPAELEAVLHGHPAVLDCAVFSVADERAGELPVAAVQLDPAREVTVDDLKRLVADALATYKHLHHVVIVDAIPRLPSGKVLRRTLRDTWAPRIVADRDPG